MPLARDCWTRQGRTGQVAGVIRQESKRCGRRLAEGIGARCNAEERDLASCLLWSWYLPNWAEINVAQMKSKEQKGKGPLVQSKGKGSKGSKQSDAMGPAPPNRYFSCSLSPPPPRSTDHHLDSGLVQIAAQSDTSAVKVRKKRPSTCFSLSLESL